MTDAREKNTTKLDPDLIKIFSGNANKPLAEKICSSIGLPLGQALVKRFSDGEAWVEIKENVRGREVFVIQPTCRPVNDHLMELLVMTDALKRASAEKITAVLPYYGYSRQDRKVAPRTPISARLMADLFTAAGVARLICVDLHAGQIQGFFDGPVDNLFSKEPLLERIREMFPDPKEELVIVAPDAGGVERARAFAKRLGSGLVIIDKRRDEPNRSKAMNVIGDVQGKCALLIDDMIDTAGTLCQGEEALRNKGAKNTMAAAAHGVFSGKAIQNIENSGLTKVIVTDSIPLKPEAEQCQKISIVSISGLIGEAIKRAFLNESVSDLFYPREKK